MSTFGTAFMLLNRFGRNPETPPAYCADCRGKGFALSQGKNRHSRKCQRCRGKGSVAVGSTKR